MLKNVEQNTFAKTFIRGEKMIDKKPDMEYWRKEVETWQKRIKILKAPDDLEDSFRDLDTNNGYCAVFQSEGERFVCGECPLHECDFCSADKEDDDTVVTGGITDIFDDIALKRKQLLAVCQKMLNKILSQKHLFEE